jgi:hypothetical protein
MIESILDSTKKNLGIEPEYAAFDDQIIMHINSVFSTLQQLGVGPVNGYMIEDATPTWSDFLADDPRYNQVRTYVYLRVRLMFDPPATSFAINSMEEQAKEMEWRMNVTREGDEWVHPDPPVVLEDIIDGGYYAP